MKAMAAYLQQRREKVTAILRLPPQHYVPETFHELRVEIKKFRALIALVKAVSGNCSIKKRQLQCLRSVFKSAGIIRERQLEAAFVQSSLPTTHRNALALFQLNLTIAEEIQKAQFFACLDKNLLQTITMLFDLTENCIGQLDKAPVRHFLQRQNERMKRQLRGRTTIRQLHALRKQLKAHTYALSCAKYQPEKWDADRIARLLDLLGAWQDCEAMLDSFGGMSTHAPCMQSAQRLLIGQLTGSKQNLQHQIVDFQKMMH